MEKFRGGNELYGVGGGAGYGPGSFSEHSLTPIVRRQSVVHDHSSDRSISINDSKDHKGTPQPVLGGSTERGQTVILEHDDCRAVRANVDVGETARAALAQTLAEPITDVLMLGIRLPEGSGEDAEITETMDKACGVLKMVLDPEEFASSMADKAVEHLTSHLLTAALGPAGPFIAVFAGKFAGDLVRQVFGPDRSEGARAAKDIVEVADVMMDASLGRLAESDQFREYVSDLVSRPIAAILDSGSPTVPDHAAGETTSRPAVISIELVLCKVEGSADERAAISRVLDLRRRLDERRARAGRAQQEEDFEAASSLLYGEIPALERDLADLAAGPGRNDSRPVHVQPISFGLTCVPDEAVAVRRTVTSYQPRKFEQDNMVLTDGTLIERRIDGETHRRWVRVDDWPVTTNWPEAEELLERRAYRLAVQPESNRSPAPVDADLLSAYRSLKKWATRNGLQ